MELMPEELVASVFQFFDLRDLGRLAGACRAWKKLTENPVLRLDIKSITLHDMTIDNVYNITRGIRKCEKLYLNKCTISSNKLGNIIKDISSSLRTIKLLSCNLDDLHTAKIFQAAGTCKNLEKLVMISESPKLNLFIEDDVEPITECEKLHTVELDGLEVTNFQTISSLMSKVWRFHFTCLDLAHNRKIVYAYRLAAFYPNNEQVGFRLFPHPGSKDETPVFPENHGVHYSPVKWTFKSDTYQVIEREKLFLADQDETINEDLKDLSEEMQDRAKRELFDSNEAYVMVVQFEEEVLQFNVGTLQRRYPMHNAQIDYCLKTRPPFWPKNNFQ